MLRNPESIGIYVHFPYCIHKCRYCDFFSIGMDTIGWGKEARPDDLEAFAETVLLEFGLRSAGAFAAFADVNTVYFGGGTASLLPAAVLKRLLVAFRARYRFTDDCEITLEGNPENFTADYLSELYDLGVTRVNSGIQTFEPRHLARVGRYYDAARYATIMEVLSQSPIRTVGVDLMYGFPDQTHAEFQSDVRRVLDHRIEHLSVYSLTAEPGTAFASDIQEGREKGPEEELQAAIFRELPALLRPRGFSQYEVSNFALPGHECRHNLRYWLYEPYLALGPGAHGFTGTERYANARHVARWQAAPAGAPYEDHQLATDLSLNFLRLTGPIPVDLPDQILREYKLVSLSSPVVRPFLLELVRSGDAELLVGSRGAELLVDGAGGGAPGTGALFRWTERGLLRLDEHVLACSERISAALTAGVSAG